MNGLQTIMTQPMMSTSAMATMSMSVRSRVQTSLCRNLALLVKFTWFDDTMTTQNLIRELQQATIQATQEMQARQILVPPVACLVLHHLTMEMSEPSKQHEDAMSAMTYNMTHRNPSSHPTSTTQDIAMGAPSVRPRPLSLVRANRRRIAKDFRDKHLLELCRLVFQLINRLLVPLQQQQQQRTLRPI